MDRYDRYKNFRDLADCETEFYVQYRDRQSEVSIIAPHGGNIEPNTTEIARLIAADDLNLFCFNGLKAGSNRDLHITSHRFDHPQALTLVRSASIVIAVHGCFVVERVIYIGGLDRELMEETGRQLDRLNLKNECGNKRFAGINPDNICNRGLRRKGMQIEISRPLRDSSAARQDIAAAVRLACLTLMEQENGRG